MEPISINTILDFLKESVEQKRILDAHQWVNAAQSLNTLLGDEHDKLYHLQQEVAKKRIALLESGMNVSQSKMHVEGSDEYRNMLSQKALIGRVEEMIRIAKIQGRLKDNEYRMQ